MLGSEWWLGMFSAEGLGFSHCSALCWLPAPAPLFLESCFCTRGGSSGLSFCALALHIHRELVKSKVRQNPPSVLCGSFCRCQSWLSEAPGEQRVRGGSFSQGSLKLLCHRSLAELQIGFSSHSFLNLLLFLKLQ